MLHFIPQNSIIFYLTLDKFFARINCVKKINKIKKPAKKIDTLKVPKIKNKRNKNEVDLWKEIRMSIKPLVKVYNKISEKRKNAKQKEEERKLRQDEKQRFREEEMLKLQEQEERIFQKEKETKVKKEKILQEQEKKRLEEKKIKDDRDVRIEKEQNYRKRLAKGDQERINQLKRVSEAKNEERKLREERYLVTESKFFDKQNSEEERLKDEEQRLNEKEQRLKNEEQRLNEKEQRLKEDKKINLKNEKKYDGNDTQKKKILNGTVLWFNDTKGYGFIKREDKEKDIFVHCSAVQNSGLSFLKKDEQLTFEVVSGDKGLSAINLQKKVNVVSRLHLKVIK